MASYEFLKIKDPNSNGILNITRAIPAILADAGQSGYTLYGVFFGLLGLSSNELYLVAVREKDDPVSDFVTPLAGRVLDQGFSIPENNRLSPTVRPIDHAMRTKDGIYVFRWFDVNNRDVDEIVQLSDEAWVSFEGGFDSEVQGLFAERDRSDRAGKMLLLTRYRNLGVWEESRKPSKEAKDRFLRRHELTIETIAIATRLYQFRK